MMRQVLALAFCGVWLSACVPDAGEQVWLGVDGEPVHTDREARQLVAARQLCGVIDQGYGVLGEPADGTASCMAAQGFTLTGTVQAQTRPIVPGGR